MKLPAVTQTERTLLLDLIEFGLKRAERGENGYAAVSVDHAFTSRVARHQIEALKAKLFPALAQKETT